MTERRKTPRELFMEFPVSKMNYSQVPSPDAIFSIWDSHLDYLKEQYLKARIFFDNYISSLEYEILSREPKRTRQYSNEPKYARHKERAKDELILPMVKEVLPNHEEKNRRVSEPI